MPSNNDDISLTRLMPDVSLRPRDRLTEWRNFLNRSEDSIGGEQTMPSRLRSRDEFLQEVVAPEEAPSTTRDGQLNHSFLTMQSTEILGVITEIHRSDGYYGFRQYLINRPFYMRSIQDRGDGWLSMACRCIGRREEIASGVRELRDLRSFSLSKVKVRNIRMEEREEAFNAYQRLINPSIAEVEEGFEFKVVPDDESKMKKRKVTKRIVKFGGVWTQECAIPENRGRMFMRLIQDMNVSSAQVFQNEVTVVLCNHEGRQLPGVCLMTFRGDNLDGDAGAVTLHTGINSNCPFELNARGEIVVINEGGSSVEDR